MDFVYHLWAVSLYHRWLGARVSAGTWTLAVLATLAEPFSFQLMRHAGAVLGWIAFLSGRLDWTQQRALHHEQPREPNHETIHESQRHGADRRPVRAGLRAGMGGANRQL